MNTLYDQLLKAIQKHRTAVKLRGDIDAYNVGHVVNDIVLHHPELFWFTEQYHFDEDSHTLHLEYGFTVEERTKASEMLEIVKFHFFQEGVNRISDVKCKALYVYQWLHNHSAYSPIHTASTIFDVFVHQRANSEGFAKAVQFLFQQMGMEAPLVYGSLRDGLQPNRHCWNLVRLEDIHYHFDVTRSYSAQSAVTGRGVICYQGFCRSAGDFRATHELPCESLFPSCPLSLSLAEVEHLLFRLRNSLEKNVLSYHDFSSNCNFENPKCGAVPENEKTSAAPLCSPSGKSTFSLYCEECAEDLEEEAAEYVENKDIRYSISEDFSPHTPMEDDSSDLPETYEPISPSEDFGRNATHKHLFPLLADSISTRLLRKSRQEVCGSVFAPLEVKKGARMLVEVFLHLPDDTHKVVGLAQEAQKEARRRNYVSLDCLVKRGENIGVTCQFFNGDRLLSEDRKSVVWKGKIARCPFDCLLPKDLSDEAGIFCRTRISINGVPVGEMSFTSSIVPSPRELHGPVKVKKFNKVFISYAHEDYESVKYIAIAYKAQGIPYFFDKKNLQTGDIYEEKIFNYIDTADLFVLCWSAHAAKSVNVGRERQRALAHAYPQKSWEEATLEIRPISIEPHADFPDDMKDIYHFEEV